MEKSIPTTELEQDNFIHYCEESIGDRLIWEEL